jgi:hypothetical protein
MNIRSVVLAIMIVVGSAASDASEAGQINQTPIHRNVLLKKPQVYRQYAISSCNGPCCFDAECSGQLVCLSGKCADDPDIGTSICSSSLLEKDNLRKVTAAAAR